MFAIPWAFERHDDAGKGRRGAAGRRIFDNAPASREHARMPVRSGGCDLRRIEENRRAAVLAPQRQIRLGSSHGVETGDGHEKKRRAGAIDGRPMGAKTDIVGAEAEVGGEALARRRFARAFGKTRQGEIGGHRLTLAMARDADDIADFLLEDEAQVLARQQVGRAQMGEQDRGSDRRMAGEGQFAAGRENAQARGVDRVARLHHEDRFGEIELASDLLHARRIEPFAIEHDGERIAG